MRRVRGGARIAQVEPRRAVAGLSQPKVDLAAQVREFAAYEGARVTIGRGARGQQFEVSALDVPAEGIDLDRVLVQFTPDRAAHVGHEFGWQVGVRFRQRFLLGEPCQA